MDNIERISRKTEFKEEKIEKEAKLSWDGDQFLVRIPTKITKFFNLKRGCSLKFIVDVPYAKKQNKRIMLVEIER